MRRQYGVIPCRAAPEGTISILLITSRDTRRWVVPRGNPISGLSAPESGAQEAYEEAGVRGLVAPEPAGRYRYRKLLRYGLMVHVEVELFHLHVTEICERWPEMKQRDRRWFSPDEAADAVAEPALKRLLRAAGNAKMPVPER